MLSAATTRSAVMMTINSVHVLSFIVSLFLLLHFTLVR